MTQNEHVYAICCGMGVDDDVIVKTVEGYIVVNFEVATSSSFRDFAKRLFCDVEIGDRNSGMNAICSRTEVADDVISMKDVDIFQYQACVNLRCCYFQ